MRTVDGLKIAFIESGDYFTGFHTPSMTSTARATGANVVLLLSPGKTADDLSDDDIRSLLGLMPGSTEAGDGDT